MHIQPLQVIGVEWLWVVLLAAVLLFGSKKLPELARALGKAMAEFQKGRGEIERELRESYQQVTEGVKSGFETPAKQAFTISTEREKLEKIARELEIASQGKTDDELRAEIQKALAKS